MTLSALLLLQDAVADGFANELVYRFNEGGGYMWPVLITLIIGLAIAFERILSLNRADINAPKFMAKVKGSPPPRTSAPTRAARSHPSSRPASPASTRAWTPSRRRSSPTAPSR